MNKIDDVQLVALEKVYETIIQWDECGGKRSRRELAKQIIDLYTNTPDAPAPDAKPVGKFAKFTDGIWREVTKGSPGVPLYEHPSAADVQELVEALRGLEEVASDCDIGYMDNAVRHARRVIEKWESQIESAAKKLAEVMDYPWDYMPEQGNRQSRC